jgi:hypothetical protein
MRGLKSRRRRRKRKQRRRKRRMMTRRSVWKLGFLSMRHSNADHQNEV